MCGSGWCWGATLPHGMQTDSRLQLGSGGVRGAAWIQCGARCFAPRCRRCGSWAASAACTTTRGAWGGTWPGACWPSGTPTARPWCACLAAGPTTCACDRPDNARSPWPRTPPPGARHFKDPKAAQDGSGKRTCSLSARVCRLLLRRCRRAAGCSWRLPARTLVTARSPPSRRPRPTSSCWTPRARPCRTGWWATRRRTPASTSAWAACAGPGSATRPW